VHPNFHRLLLATALSLTAHPAAIAQGLPTTQPNLIVISRERVTLGHEGPHVRTESGRQATFERATSPDFYLALESMTGVPEVWFITPWDSYETWGRAMARDERNPELATALDRVREADRAHLDDADVIEAVAVPELGFGTFPDLNKMRFWEITTVLVRPGHEESFAASVLAQRSAAARASPGASWMVFRVSAGLRDGTYLILTSVESFGLFDQILAGSHAIAAAMTGQERQADARFRTEGLRSAVARRFRLSPDMSYVPAGTRAADPYFWKRENREP
jgi:hypothetical protein